MIILRGQQQMTENCVDTSRYAQNSYTINENFITQNSENCVSVVTDNLLGQVVISLYHFILANPKNRKTQLWNKHEYTTEFSNIQTWTRASILSLRASEFSGFPLHVKRTHITPCRSYVRLISKRLLQAACTVQSSSYIRPNLPNAPLKGDSLHSTSEVAPTCGLKGKELCTKRGRSSSSIKDFCKTSYGAKYIMFARTF